MPETVSLKPGVTSYNVTMKEDTKTLDEVVVVGYGVQKKANLTGAVSSINAEALESRSVSSVSAAMAGTMPGVTAIQSSGAPGYKPEQLPYVVKLGECGQSVSHRRRCTG